MQEQQYVGIDPHRRRSVIVRMNDAGEVLSVTKVANDPVQMSMAIAYLARMLPLLDASSSGWAWTAIKVRGCSAIPYNLKE